MQAGEKVWARVGTYGWRPAVVKSVGGRMIYLDFEGGGCGRRISSIDLVHRDPDLKGRDKPSPKDAKMVADVVRIGEGL